jgi:hypothetical protein
MLNGKQCENLNKSLIRGPEVDFDPEIPKADRCEHNESFTNSAEWNNVPERRFLSKIGIASFDDHFLKKRRFFVRMVIIRDSQLNEKSTGKSPERS